MPFDAIRTPEERFSDLPDFPYEPHYVDDLPGYEGLRMAYIDEGEGDEVFLCLHGEPTWSFLYRKMIPVFAAAGKRVIAPDLFGFGRSDKLVNKDDYSYTFHRESWMRFVEKLDLKNITLVCQDWGGILGLTLPMDMPGRFERLLVMNTGLPVEPESAAIWADINSGEAPKTGFGKWRALALATPDLPVGAIVQTGCSGVLTPEEIAAYDAPFPDESYKLCAHWFPALVPFHESMDGYATGRRAIEFWNTWTGPAFMVLGDADKVIPPKAMDRLRQEINNCPPPHIIEGGGHFVQEWGDEVARAALDYFAKN